MRAVSEITEPAAVPSSASVREGSALMTLLSNTDPLPRRPSRVLVAGTTGAGKTTLARQIAGALGIPHYEMDAMYHGPQWTVRPQFQSDVEAMIARSAWVTEWQYEQARPLLAAHADALVWLDLSRSRVMRQVIRRTIRRTCRREVLWNGNVEQPLARVLFDPDHVIRWAWRTHHSCAGRVANLRATHPQLPIIRLRTHTEVKAWLAGPLVDTRSTS